MKKRSFSQRLSKIENFIQSIPTWLLITCAVVCLGWLAIWLEEDANKITPKDYIRIIFSNAESIAIASAVILYFKEAPDRKDQKYYETWQVIENAEGKETSYSRYKALQDLNKGNVSLRGLDAPGADLKEIKLPQADLREASFNEAQLDKADLSNAWLHEADFNPDYPTSNGRSSLCETDLTKAVLEKAKLNNVDLNEAILVEAKLMKAELWRASLVQANLTGADLTGANFKEADLTRANLAGAIVKEANFTKAIGLTNEEVLALKARGAIFEDLS